MWEQSGKVDIFGEPSNEKDEVHIHRGGSSPKLRVRPHQERAPKMPSKTCVPRAQEGFWTPFLEILSLMFYQIKS